MSARATLLVAILAVACGGGTKPAGKTASDAEAKRPPSARQSELADAGRCMIRLHAEKDVTEVVSELDGYGLLLPGTEWALRCEDDTPLMGSAGLLRLSVSFGKPGARSLEQHLRLVADRASQSLASMGMEASHPEIVKVGTSDGNFEKLILSYEVSGGEIEQMEAKSVHAWSAIQTQNGAILEYHLSWTGSRTDWQEGMLPALRKMLLPFLPLQPEA
ncbi:MAG TPA: hypothetical protein VM686_26765 [Polyangiaceae bacterium]|nr:hypothetical protein [Polyangiaceae bacterium]